jgi:hypothetical protein
MRKVYVVIEGQHYGGGDSVSNEFEHQIEKIFTTRQAAVDWVISETGKEEFDEDGEIKFEMEMYSSENDYGAYWIEEHDLLGEEA